MGTILDEILRDQVIWSVGNTNIIKRLLSKETITFKTCIELC